MEEVTLAQEVWNLFVAAKEAMCTDVERRLDEEAAEIVKSWRKDQVWRKHYLIRIGTWGPWDVEVLTEEGSSESALNNMKERNHE